MIPTTPLTPFREFIVDHDLEYVHFAPSDQSPYIYVDRATRQYSLRLRSTHSFPPSVRLRDIPANLVISLSRKGETIFSNGLHLVAKEETP